ncbi:hypothetical protein MRX96_047308 [Rhipicephalus microplus]
MDLASQEATACTAPSVVTAVTTLHLTASVMNTDSVASVTFYGSWPSYGYYGYGPGAYYGYPGFGYGWGFGAGSSAGSACPATNPSCRGWQLECRQECFCLIFQFQQPVIREVYHNLGLHTKVPALIAPVFSRM